MSVCEVINQLLSGTSFPVSLLRSLPIALPRSPAPAPRHACSVSACGCLHTARFETESKKKRGESRDWRTSGSNKRLKNDVMSVAVRPRPVRKRRERLLVKFCGRGWKKKKRFGYVSKLHPSSPGIKTLSVKALSTAARAKRDRHEPRQSVDGKCS